MQSASERRRVRHRPGADVRLHALPAGDPEFQAFAETALAILPEPRAAPVLQRALRVRYPAATVTAAATTSEDPDEPVVWQVDRRGEPGGGGADRLRARAGAWAILDDDRRFVEVSTGLARIAELPARTMVGHRIEDFSNPADPTIRDDIAGLWAYFRARGALASSLRFNYGDGRPRELAYRLEANADGAGRHRLTVRVETPED